MTGAFDHDGRALKVASFRLVRAVGGEKVAAELIERSTSEVQRLADKNSGERYFTARQVATLEEQAPEPVVTQALCKLAGGVFLRLPTVFEDAAGLPMHVVALARELGDVSAKVTEVLADGVIRPAEAAEVERELDELIEKAVEARELVQRMQGLRDVASGEARNGP